MTVESRHNSLQTFSFYLSTEVQLTSCSTFNQASDSNEKAEVLFWGDIETEKGGSDLIFEQYLDDQTTADVVWIKRVIMHCMEVLFYKEKWEKLVDIILRFNALSRYVNIARFMSVVLGRLHKKRN